MSRDRFYFSARPNAEVMPVRDVRIALFLRQEAPPALGTCDRALVVITSNMLPVCSLRSEVPSLLRPGRVA